MNIEKTQIIIAIIELAKARESAIANGENTTAIDEGMNILVAQLVAE